MRTTPRPDIRHISDFPVCTLSAREPSTTSKRVSEHRTSPAPPPQSSLRLFVSHAVVLALLPQSGCAPAHADNSTAPPPPAKCLQTIKSDPPPDRQYSETSSAPRERERSASPSALPTNRRRILFHSLRDLLQPHRAKLRHHPSGLQCSAKLRRIRRKQPLRLHADLACQRFPTLRASGIARRISAVPPD